MHQGLTAETKALLISIGSGDVDPSLLPEDLKTVATAGPGAGGTSFFISDGQHRVRLSLNKESSLKTNSSCLCAIVLNRPISPSVNGAYSTANSARCHS